MTRRQRFFRKQLAKLRAARAEIYLRGIICYRGNYAIFYKRGFYYLLQKGDYHWRVIERSPISHKIFDLATQRVKNDTCNL